MNNIRISVAMAVYNGEKYIREQLISILKQLSENDEIIISDDGSVDKTTEQIKMINDNRIKLIEGPKLGIKKNFENAIRNCKGKYIFLADQDDVWFENKVSTILDVYYKTNAILVMHDCYVVNENKEIIGDSFFDFRKCKKGIINNIIKNSFIGCCISFRSDLVRNILPIPNNVAMHDQWIGLVASLCGKVEFIDDKLIFYRRHSNNASQFKRNNTFKMVTLRIILIFNIFVYVIRRCMDHG